MSFFLFCLSYKHLDSLSFGGMQFQKIQKHENTSLRLSALGSEWENGIDITDNNLEYDLSSELWSEQTAPNTFILSVYESSMLLNQFIMSYNADIIRLLFYLLFL